MNRWWPQNDDSLTQSYISAHYEFDWDMIETGRPYSGAPWSDAFVSVPRSPAWRLKHDHILNGLTADILATLESYNLPYDRKHYGGAPGGWVAEEFSAYLPILDGGVFVIFRQHEHEYTNAVQAYQATLVFGPKTLRHIISSLDFVPPSRRLKGEQRIPDQSEISSLLNLQLTPGTVESETLNGNFQKDYEKHHELALKALFSSN